MYDWITTNDAENLIISGGFISRTIPLPASFVQTLYLKYSRPPAGSKGAFQSV